MDGDFEIIGKVVVDSSGAVSIQGLNDSLGETETRTSALGSISDIVWSGIILGGINLVWEGIKNVISSVIEFGKSSVDSAMESEGVIAKLNAVLEATHYAAGLSSEQLQAMAESLQGVTRYSDETILTGASLLLTFRNIGEEAMQRVLPDMLDMAEIFGSVDSAAMQLGKALNDPIAGMGALGRAGVTFSDEQKEVIKAFMATGDIASAQNVILTELENQVQGVAVAYGQTMAGQIEIAKNKLDNLKELIGGPILYVMGQMTGAFGSFMDSPGVKTITAFLTDLNKYLNEGVDPLLAIGYSLNNLGPQFHDLAIDVLQLWDALKEGATPQEALLGFFDKLTGLGDTPFEIGQSILNAIKNIDWTTASQNLADGIKNIDWVKVGSVIQTGVGLALAGIDFLLDEVIGRAIENADWDALAQSLGVALSGMVAGGFGYVSWDALAVDFNNGLASIFGYTGAHAFDQLKANFQDAIDWLTGLHDQWVQVGRDLIDGIKSGFEGGISGWFNRAKTFWEDYIGYVKTLLQIASPSGVFKSIGMAIVDGLIAGWNATVGAFLTLIGTTIADIGELFGIDLSGLLGGSSASGLGTAGGGTSGGTTGGGTGGGSGTVINQYFYDVVNVGAMSDLISFDCTVNPVVTATYPTVGGGLGSGPVGGVAV